MQTTADTGDPSRAVEIAPDRPWLAPLAGFSDVPFRMLCREYGAAVACTEMISAKGLIYGGRETWDLTRSPDPDRPLVVQLFGEDPYFLREAVRRLLERGHFFFDLNAGCPVKKVVKTGAGAGLLREPGRLRGILGEMAELAGPGRVGVKLRSGFRDAEFVSGPGVRKLEGIPLGWVTLHPRSANQGLSGKADWSQLQRLKEQTRVPVLASGDLFNAAQGVHCLESTGVDGVMFARGAMDNPAVFADYLRALGWGETREPEGYEDQSRRLQAAKRHVALCRQYAESRKSLLKMRTVLPRYLRGMPRAREIRSRVVRAKSWEEIEGLLAELSSCA